jgi:3-oxoacyl-[acyl-carrier protein] reductase
MEKPSGTAHRYPSLEGRVVLITGGSRGLGREMAIALAQQGARLAVTGSRPSEALDQSVADLKALAGEDQVIGLVADVRDYDACRQAVADTLARFGALDAVVNNAAFGMRLISETYNAVPTKFWEADPAAWRAIVDANVTGVFHMARAAVPEMVARGFGKLINVSTSSQTMNRQGYTPYGPSKAAIEAMGKAWAKELSGTGVNVNTYLPGGASDTDIMPGGKGRTGADGNIFPASMMRRAICWLCADDSNGKTGGRYVARLWDESLPPDEAASKAFDLAY